MSKIVRWFHTGRGVALEQPAACRFKPPADASATGDARSAVLLSVPYEEPGALYADICPDAAGHPDSLCSVYSLGERQPFFLPANADDPCCVHSDPLLVQQGREAENGSVFPPAGGTFIQLRSWV